MNAIKIIILLLLLWLFAGCHKKGDRFVDCNCVSGHTDSGFMYIYNADGSMTLIPTSTYVCDFQTCDSVYIDSLGKKQFIKHLN